MAVLNSGFYTFVAWKQKSACSCPVEDNSHFPLLIFKSTFGLQDQQAQWHICLQGSLYSSYDILDGHQFCLFVFYHQCFPPNQCLYVRTKLSSKFCSLCPKVNKPKINYHKADYHENKQTHMLYCLSTSC